MPLAMQVDWHEFIDFSTMLCLQKKSSLEAEKIGFNICRTLSVMLFYGDSVMRVWGGSSALRHWIQGGKGWTWCLACVWKGCLEKRLSRYWVGVNMAVMRAGQTQTQWRDFADVIKVPNQTTFSKQKLGKSDLIRWALKRNWEWTPSCSQSCSHSWEGEYTVHIHPGEGISAFCPPCPA